MIEEWIEFASYKDWRYLVSPEGEIKRDIRIALNNRLYNEKTIKPSFNTEGFLQVRLITKFGLEFKFVHRIVAEAFLENPNSYKYVIHKNGDKTDNKIGNLEWRRDNMSFRNNHKILTEKDVEEIKKLLSRYSDSIIGRVFKVNRKTIYNIRNGRTWT